MRRTSKWSRAIPSVSFAQIYIYYVVLLRFLEGNGVGLVHEASCKRTQTKLKQMDRSGEEDGLSVRSIMRIVACSTQACLPIRLKAQHLHSRLGGEKRRGGVEIVCGSACVCTAPPSPRPYPGVRRTPGAKRRQMSSIANHSHRLFVCLLHWILLHSHRNNNNVIRFTRRTRARTHAISLVAP